MNDDKLKNFLKKDNSMPKASTNEWAIIQNKIEEPSIWARIFSFNNAQLAIAFSLLLFGVIGPNVFTEADTETDLVEFYLEDDYFSEETNLYTWVDVSEY